MLQAPPPPSAAALAAARPATVVAVVSLAGSGLWPFTPLQQVPDVAAQREYLCLDGMGAQNSAELVRCHHTAVASEQSQQGSFPSQAALRGVVLQSLANVESDITEAQLTIGAAKVVS